MMTPTATARAACRKCSYLNSSGFCKARTAKPAISDDSRLVRRNRLQRLLARLRHSDISAFNWQTRRPHLQLCLGQGHVAGQGTRHTSYYCELEAAKHGVGLKVGHGYSSLSLSEGGRILTDLKSETFPSTKPGIRLLLRHGSSPDIQA